MKLTKLITAVVASLLPALAAGKSVFAHVVVGDTAAHTQDTWAQDIQAAQQAGIDAFVLNCGYPDSNIPPQVANAFAAAEAANFKLFFSFDYLGGGQPWPATGSYSVDSVLSQYASSSAYFQYNGKPFVSTFEGTSNIGDWAPGGPIRSSTDVFFVPDWASLGPSGVTNNAANIDGAFNWGMWPNGAADMTDTLDQAYISALGSKPYMMGVSPWFFHSASGGADWIWRGDDLWHDRWEEVFQLAPEFVEIVTWNDFGESSYIGPFHSASEVPAGSDVYVENMPHDGWRALLPWYIGTYKGQAPAVTEDQVQFWYRTAPAAAGNACGVTGNSASQGQTEVDPNTVAQDKVFFTALLQSAATVQVQIGSSTPVTYQGQSGINHWNQDFNGQTGAVTISVIRNGATVKSGNGTPITSGTTLSNGCTNYNAWVGSF